MQINTAVDLPVRQSEKADSYIKARRAWTTGLCVSGVLGIAAGLIGIIFSLESLSGIAGSQMSVAGTVLIAAMFPLLILAAHCLDKIGEAKKAIRREYCRRNGLRDEEF